MFALLWPATQCTESNTFIGACDDELQEETARPCQLGHQVH